MYELRVMLLFLLLAVTETPYNNSYNNVYQIQNTPTSETRYISNSRI
jgi:hypothetical protein